MVVGKFSFHCLIHFLKVLAMIEEEKRRYRPTKNYLEHLPQLELHKFEVSNIFYYSIL